MNDKRKKACRVLAFGTFDIVHPGHLKYLTQCKKRGSHLTVVVARDQTVKRLKGRLPIFSEKDRLVIIQSLKMVDEAILGDRIHHCRVIDKVRPDILCLGYDQNITKQKLTAQLSKMKIPIKDIVRMKPYRASIHKSSLYKKNVSKKE